MPLLSHWLSGASSFSDGFDDPPEGGVVFPVIIGIVSVVLLIRQAYGLGAFVGCLSAFIHFHYFWGLTKNYLFVSFLGKNGAALAMILCIAYGVYYFVVCM
jgi:hypothetical protein